MPIKTFSVSEVLTSSDVNTYLTNGGLRYITQTLVTSGSATSVSFNNCFSSTYANYRIVIDSFQPSIAARTLLMRMRNGGTDATTTDYYYGISGFFATGAAVSDFSTVGASSMTTGLYNSVNSLALGTATIDLFNPFAAERTFGQVHQIGYDSNFFYRTGLMEHNLTNSYDGFTLLLSGTGNITTLRVRVYGYRQA